jgi:hypothetical protein
VRKGMPSGQAVERAFSPDAFTYHPHGKTSETHLAYWTVLSSCDHLLAGTRGGDWSDPANLVTACWACNARKSNLTLDQLGWQFTAQMTDGTASRGGIQHVGKRRADPTPRITGPGWLHGQTRSKNT